MVAENKFTAVVDGRKCDAYVISNFSILGDNYCAYTVGSEGKTDVYCDKVVNNSLIKIESEEEKRLVSKIVNTILKVIEGRDING